MIAALLAACVPLYLTCILHPVHQQCRISMTKLGSVAEIQQLKKVARISMADAVQLFPQTFTTHKQQSGEWVLHLLPPDVTVHLSSMLPYVFLWLRIYILTPDLISPKCCILILQHIVSQCHTTWPYDLFSQDNQVQEID